MVLTPPLLWRLGSPITALHGGNRPREVRQRAQGRTALKANLNRSTTCLWGRGCCVQASPLPGLPPRGLWVCGNEQIHLDVSFPEIIIIISSHFTPLFCDRSGFCIVCPPAASPALFPFSCCFLGTVFIMSCSLSLCNQSFPGNS